MLTLATYAKGPGRTAWPSHQTLAERCRCSVRTVQRALEQARGLGLVSWVERRVRASWRWLRTSNVYTMLVPAGAIHTTGHFGRGGKVKIKEGSKTPGTKAEHGRWVAQEPVRSVEEQIAAMLAWRRLRAPGIAESPQTPTGPISRLLGRDVIGRGCASTRSGRNPAVAGVAVRPVHEDRHRVRSGQGGAPYG